ncbi:MAG: class II fumarate hydratase [Pseudomonadota bacterium]|nr:class II fumarate hydratase [Pseudomonadota bacterium]
MKSTRSERDSMGEMQVPADALYGAQTARAIQNFRISGIPMPRGFIAALGLLKATCAEANVDLGAMEPKVGHAIGDASLQVARGAFDVHFPIDVFQTGSGTSSNMNANEVIAHLAAAAAGRAVHPNDDVNMGQSSNDVIPSAIHVAACLACHENLLPALRSLKAAIDRRARELARVPKTGRTHLMDAMPLTLGQELGAWAAQIAACIERINSGLQRLCELPIGGTAVGTGVNAHPEFAAHVVSHLSRTTGFTFKSAANKFAHMASQDAAVEMSGQLRVLACALTKIANDLRWMNSGPLAGLGEIELPALQPGSSIMPGKVNPVIPESVAMVCAQVIGNDLTITVAGQSGNFQLNVMLPVIALNLLQSIEILSNASSALADQAIAGFTVNRQRIAENLARNPVLITALNSLIGYEQGAAIVKQAYREKRAVIDVAREVTGLAEAVLQHALDPMRLTGADDADVDSKVP